MTKSDLELFFAGVLEREGSITEIRAEIKEAFAAFATSHEVALPALKEGFRYHKKALKDASEAQTVEFERDKLVDILIGGSSDAVE